jgi:hypothetical protein
MRISKILVLSLIFTITSRMDAQVFIGQTSFGTTFQSLGSTYINGGSQDYAYEEFNVKQNNYLSTRFQLKYKRSMESRWNIGINAGYQNSTYFIPFAYTNVTPIEFENVYIERLDFTLNRYNFGLTGQYDFLKWAALYLGGGVTILQTDIYDGVTYSDFHFYDVDLSNLNTKSTASFYTTLGLQWNIPISQKLKINILTEVSQLTTNRIIKDLLEIKYYNLGLEVGCSYIIRGSGS